MAVAEVEKEAPERANRGAERSGAAAACGTGEVGGEGENEAGPREKETEREKNPEESVVGRGEIMADLVVSSFFRCVQE